jgi:hypothetical protein
VSGVAARWSTARIRKKTAPERRAHTEAPAQPSADQEEKAPHSPPVSPAQLPATDPPTRSAARETGGIPERVAERVSTGTDGRVIAFPVSTSPSNPPDSQRIDVTAEPEQEQRVTRSLIGLVKPRTWRPKLSVKNREYPGVTSPGTYFITHSGGFQLYQQKTREYLGHYTKAAIRELERLYGKTRSRKRK